MDRYHSGGVYYDHRHPVRLAAVERGDVHYAGSPCTRDSNHLGLRYAKSGKCVECSKGDRNRYGKTEKGLEERKRHHQRKAIKLRKGAARGPAKWWWERLALYEKLVEGGLPVNPEQRLQQRVSDAWFAFHALTSDTPVLSQGQHESQRRQRTAERREQKNQMKVRERELAAFARSNGIEPQRLSHKMTINQSDAETAVAAIIASRELDAFARAHGVQPKQLKDKMRFDKCDADTAVASIIVRTKEQQWAKIARQNGINIFTYRARVYNFGWTREAAATTPVTANLPDERTTLARGHGISPATYKARLKRGIDRITALSKTALPSPIQRDPTSLAGQARAAGIPEGTLWGRVKLQGMTVQEAIALGPRRRGEVSAATAEAQAAGYHPATIKRRMDRLGITAEAAIALGAPGYWHRDSVAAKARAAGYNPATIKKRMDRLGLPVEAAIALGAPGSIRPHRYSKSTPAKTPKLTADQAERRATRIACKVEREAARLASETTYVSSRTCKRCSGTIFYTVSGGCKRCITDRASARYYAEAA